MVEPGDKPKAKYRYRSNWLGQLVLQVSVPKHYCYDLNGSGYFDEGTYTVWKDARVTDIEWGTFSG